MNEKITKQIIKVLNVGKENAINSKTLEKYFDDCFHSKLYNIYNCYKLLSSGISKLFSALRCKVKT